LAGDRIRLVAPGTQSIEGRVGYSVGLDAEKAEGSLPQQQSNRPNVS